MTVRIFWVRAMECMCAKTRPRFILSSERVWGDGVRIHVSSKAKIPSTGKTSPQRRIEPTTRHHAATTNPTYYQRANPAPTPNHVLLDRDCLRGNYLGSPKRDQCFLRGSMNYFLRGNYIDVLNGLNNKMIDWLGHDPNTWLIDETMAYNAMISIPIIICFWLPVGLHHCRELCGDDRRLVTLTP